MGQFPSEVLEVLHRLRQAGFEAWLVGGCVRDLLRGVPPHDWDFCTSALPAQTAAVFSDRKLILSGAKHGTVAIAAKGGPFEITTFRADVGYSDGRRPDEVRFVDQLEEDLSRRDFTINAIAMDDRGQIKDPFDGQKDLRSGIVRCVGDPDTRFREDGLRVLRALRFASVLGFQLEPRTSESVLRCGGMLSHVAKERIGSEFGKLLTGGGAGPILLKYASVLREAVPGLPGVCADPLWSSTVRALEYTEPELQVRLAVLFSARESEDLDAILLELRLERRIRTAVKELVQCCREPVPADQAGMRRRLGQLGTEQLRRLLQVQYALAGSNAERTHLSAAGVLMERIMKEDSCCTVLELQISGCDVMRVVGCRGPRVGEILKEILEQVVTDRLPNHRRLLLEYLSSNYT